MRRLEDSIEKTYKWNAHNKIVGVYIKEKEIVVYDSPEEKARHMDIMTGNDWRAVPPFENLLLVVYVRDSDEWIINEGVM